jgi:hypothetical protein
MARTKFSGPVVSDNGFQTSSTISASSLTINNSLTIGSGWNANSGTVSAAIGYIPVNVGGVTKYIQLFSSLTP